MTSIFIPQTFPLDQILAEAIRRFEMWINDPYFIKQQDWRSVWLMSMPFHAPQIPDISETVGMNIYIRQSTTRPFLEREGGLTMLEIGNFGADDLELGRQFLQSFVQEAHLRHPWQATFVSDGDVVALMGDMTKWFVRDMSGEVGPPHQTYYYLIK